MVRPHGAVEAAAIGVGASATQVDLNAALLGRAPPRGEQHDGDEGHDNDHDDHVIDADELRAALEHVLEIGAYNLRGDYREPQATTQKQHGDEPDGEPLALMNGAFDVFSPLRHTGELAEPLRPEEEHRR